ncbi:MAG TPA: M28 family peptidase [Bacteroidia bacterium]
MKKICLLLSCFYSSIAFSQANQEAALFAKSIQANDLKALVYDLAGDEFEGRETGKLGQKKAAEYLQEKFKSFGIPPVINGMSYLQTFPLYEEYPGSVNIQINNKNYQFLKDFYCFNNFSDLAIDFNSITFAGYGINDKNSGYNDYKNLDVKGKVVIVLEDEPINKAGISRITGTYELSEWSQRRNIKSAEAKNQGAIALIQVSRNIENDLKYLKHYLEQPKTTLAENKEEKRGFPTFYISKEIANELFINHDSKTSYEAVKELFRKKKSIKGYELNKSAGKISVKRERVNITGENVLGYIEGTDLKDELIILTAHYDHLGKHDGKVYYGADDDGSGTAAIIEIAEAFMIAKRAGFSPRRSILIMPVSGEEKGLLGSMYYTQNPIFPLENTVCNLNIDMIGRMDKDHKNDPNYVYIIGSDKLSSELHAANENNNSAYINIKLDYRYNVENEPNQFYYRSDHYNFAKNNIPCIFYFTGVHEDYHQPSDTPDKLHYEKMETITRLIFYTAWDIANRDKRLVVDSNKK